MKIHEKANELDPQTWSVMRRLYFLMFTKDNQIHKVDLFQKHLFIQCLYNNILSIEMFGERETVCLILYHHTFIPSLFYLISTSLSGIVNVSGIPALLPAENYLSVKLWGRHRGVFLLRLSVQSLVGALLCSTTAVTSAPNAASSICSKQSAVAFSSAETVKWCEHKCISWRHSKSCTYKDSSA